MSWTSRRDYLQRIYPRYHRASRAEKRCIPDEFCTNCGYHRKYAIRVLNRPPRSPKLNGQVKRAHRTHLEEFYEITPLLAPHH